MKKEEILEEIELLKWIVEVMEKPVEERIKILKEYESTNKVGAYLEKSMNHEVEAFNERLRVLEGLNNFQLWRNESKKSYNCHERKRILEKADISYLWYEIIIEERKEEEHCECLVLVALNVLNRKDLWEEYLNYPHWSIQLASLKKIDKREEWERALKSEWEEVRTATIERLQQLENI